MAGKWDYSVINQIQQANDIVEVIAEHLKLEKKGKEMEGLCPAQTEIDGWNEWRGRSPFGRG